MVGLRLGFVVLAAAVLLDAGPALASLTSGRAGCTTLSSDKFEQLGEYAMDRMVGSRTAHGAMNDRMTRAIGADNTDRMHELMGRRYAECAGGDGAVGMMRSSDWSWMRGDAWQRMSQGDWRHLASTMMGSRYAAPGDHHWSTTGVAAIVIGAALLTAVLALVAVRYPWRRRPPAAASGT